MYTNNGYNAYTAVSLDSQIAGATPHQLIVLLYDGAINAMRRAEIYFQSGNIARRGEMISRAINIIDNGLRAGLDHEKGGQIAAELESLYEYISRTLLEANLNKSGENLPHLISLMTEMQETWQAINPENKQVKHG
ncbi:MULTISPECIES: flagellar export chaperone FliS [Enterobacter]|jgi:flagellar protein FliS|uniref:flagellar export chaperone FliS n=1 Tax=Enterobacter TaxID=547 RepID=UPI0003D8D617|nr:MULTISPECIES: flagellar export chaperone FliS [Enterobacter]AHE70057.1 flagellar biosynthesis protein FliS [Enterobacter ludwigii]AOT43666.1 flagellar export chaperone FliS [Enterobacter ludwigii]ELK6457943.1 flagellar export chaperone FliS [Enterobacter ludwigii]ELN9420542.1 flagellar export chaperone FliS [Enterobacter ludwigii]KIF86212.1 flagellar protein FliS [Enterobacter ludwigii]